MVMELQGGFLQMTDEDKLIDKFIDEKGNISEDELASLVAKKEQVDEDEQEPETGNDSAEPPEEPRSDEGEDDAELESDGQGESSESESEPLQGKDKKSRIESNQAKAIRIEREKRRELEKALKLQADRSAKIEEVLNTVLQPKEEVKENVPDPDEDPVGFQNYKIEKLEKLQQQQQEYMRQQHEYQKQLEQEKQFMSLYTQDAQSFAQKTPDFMDAYRFVVNDRIEEHMIAGFDRNTAEQLLKQEEAAWVAKAFQDQESPSARIYALAKKRGYAQGPKQSATPKTSKLETLKQGIKSSKSLGPNVGGGQHDEDTLDISDIDSMSDKDIDKLWKLMKAGKLKV